MRSVGQSALSAFLRQASQSSVKGKALPGRGLSQAGYSKGRSSRGTANLGCCPSSQVKKPQRPREQAHSGPTPCPRAPSAHPLRLIAAMGLNHSPPARVCLPAPPPPRLPAVLALLVWTAMVTLSVWSVASSSVAKYTCCSSSGLITPWAMHQPMAWARSRTPMRCMCRSRNVTRCRRPALCALQSPYCHSRVTPPAAVGLTPISSKS
jgi:hypothetical protein